MVRIQQVSQQSRHSRIEPTYAMMMILCKILFLSTLWVAASAFVPAASSATGARVWTDVFTTSSPVPSSATTLNMAEDEKDQEFMRWARASRSASSDDNVVELQRPLGLVLNQDDKGNVFVETVAPKGNAARTGKVRLGIVICSGIATVYVCVSLSLSSISTLQVKEGDIVTMCSATFGEDMWSTRYVLVECLHRGGISKMNHMWLTAL